MGAGSAVEALGTSQARLAQSAERKALNLVVVGSSPTVGAFLARHECDSGEFRAPALRHKGFSGILTRLRQLVIGNYVSSVGSIYMAKPPRGEVICN